MKTRLLYMLSFVAALTLTGCPDPPCFNPDPSYTFAITTHFTPKQDSIQVGDTLYLVSEFPSTMVPVGGQEPVDYSNSTGIHSLVNIRELISGTNKIVGVVSNFDYFSVDGRIYNSKEIPSPERVQQLLYAEKAGEYVLKVGLIPKKKGIYSLVIGYGISNGKTAGDKCTRAAFDITVTNTDPHMYYLEPFINDPNVDIPNIHYLFKVY
ncbi:hypothetical protein [Pontibacter sp. HSC-36F09]|uniref:hypothetical protein n=1 Tax=Pontibacter sp. HSC-36F09 TaxID=2910966 RepID=UPI00209F0D3C|nr:hypothetical protein [Pontibacter sp. HSC-36F09]MCP2045348.1 hypothetical protein [Pontibacter sp. HSC-36F09]